MTKTSQVDLLVRDATVVAFDGTSHRYIEGGSVAIVGDRISAIGAKLTVDAKRTIDARGSIVIPGQISTHAHIGAHEGPRLLVDAGRRDFVRSGFLHFLPARRSGGPGFLAPQDGRASLRYGFATLLRHGVTTVLAFGPAGADGGETMLAAAEEFGIRLYWSPLVSGGRYWLGDDGRVEREIDEKAGLADLAKAVAFVENLKRNPRGAVRGTIALDEYYVSTPALRKACKEAARALGVPFTLHFIEQHREFFDTMQSTGKTPIQILADEGVLDSGTILAHCIYHAGHSLVGYPMVDDVALLGQTGATVAHSPVAFSRRGVAFESFDRFRRAGVNVALATDTYPLDMFGEMRLAAIMCKTVEKNFEAAPAGAVFEASNLAGASALGRPDIGRIAPGATADLVVVDAKSLSFGPNPDPVRALVHLATPGMVSTVVVGGRVLVENGKITVADEAEIVASARASSERVWKRFPESDLQGRPIREAFPATYADWAGSRR